MRNQLHLLLSCFLLVWCKAEAQTPWPPFVYQAYLEQCTTSLITQGAQSKKAEQFCYCITTGLSGEFGMEEYDYIRKIQPKPKGTRREQRLYKVMEKCAAALK